LPVPITKHRAALRQIHTLFHLGTTRGLTDGQLLERFATGPGESAELAFAALVERHGAMVLRVCRSRLADPHDTQDAFQATFLVLVRKARGLWVRDSLGPWLHQVALRTAARARSDADRRRRHERRAAEAAGRGAPADARSGPDLAQRLHEEIDRLPERYRVPIVLCDLQGHTCEEAARQMGRPVGTVKCWRARGRERLRDRLAGSGTGLAVALMADVATASVPDVRAEGVVRAAVRVVSGSVTCGEVPASAWSLAQGVLKAMFISKLRTAAGAAFALVLMASGLVAVARVGAKDPDQVPDEVLRQVVGAPHRIAKPQHTTNAEKRSSWALSLRDAIRISLENSEAVRVVPHHTLVGGHEPARVEEGDGSRATGPLCVIAPRDAETDRQRFKAEVMTEVRSVEQQYWSLVYQHVQRRAGEKAVQLAEEILKREQSELKEGRGTVADVAEAQQRLEQFRLDLVTRTSDVITTERRLRSLLGLPPADDRRIVPVTAPTEAKLDPDWEDGLATMLVLQPDVVRATASMQAVGAKLTEARRDDNGTTDEPRDTARVNQIQDDLLRERAFLQQIVHQTTHSLARFFLEVDANYKQFQTASRIRATAVERLKAQRAFYEEGRITIDRYLDAVSRYASAVAQEAQFKTSYNISIVALEEAKGTLLKFDGIDMVGEPDADRLKGLKADAMSRYKAMLATDSATPVAKAAEPKTLGSDPAPAPALPTAPTVARATTPGENRPTTPKTDTAGTTVSFHWKLDFGARPVEIRGSFTISSSRPGDDPKSP